MPNGDHKTVKEYLWVIDTKLNALAQHLDEKFRHLEDRQNKTDEQAASAHNRLNKLYILWITSLLGVSTMLILAVVTGDKIHV